METNSINSFLVLITGDIDNFMYTYILVALLVFTGIYFTIRTKGVQFRYIKDMFTQLFEKKVDKNGKAISSFQAMMVSTGVDAWAPAISLVSQRRLLWVARARSSGCGSWRLSVAHRRSSNQRLRRSSRFAAKMGNSVVVLLITSNKVWANVGWASVFAVSLIACYVVGFNELQAYNAASGLEYYVPGCAADGAADCGLGGRVYTPSLLLLLSLEVRSVFRSSIRGLCPSWRLPISAWAFGSRSRI